MKRILVIGDLSSSNLGDPLLTCSCAKLVEEAVRDDEYKVSTFDIADRKKKLNKTSKTNVNRHSSKVISILQTFVEDTLNLFRWIRRDKKSFDKRLQESLEKNVTHIVIAGGALISSSSFYALRLNYIVSIAEKLNIQVVFNSIGIEKSIHNPGIAKYIVRHYLKNRTVVSFSTRDHVEDIPYLTSRKKFVKHTPDPAVFSADAYQIEKEKTNVVGISVISLNAYKSVVQNDKRAKYLTEDDLLTFWASIIERLQKDNVQFKIMTNGGPADYDMALKLTERLKLNAEDYLLPRPQTPNELIQQISQFRCLLAHRLHACIIATSLHIPVVPIVWSDKVERFAKMIHAKSYWPSLQMIDSIINQLENPYVDDSLITKLKIDAIQNLKDNIKYN